MLENNNISEVQDGTKLFCHLASIVSSRDGFWLWYHGREARARLGFYIPCSFSTAIPFPHPACWCGVPLHLLTPEGLTESGSHCSTCSEATRTRAAWTTACYTGSGCLGFTGCTVAAAFLLVPSVCQRVQGLLSNLHPWRRTVCSILGLDDGPLLGTVTSVSHLQFCHSFIPQEACKH